MDKVKWAELFPAEFLKRREEKPVVFLPLGLCEPHGHIAVLGLDLLKAEFICEQAAIKYGGVVAPSTGYQIHESGFHAPWLEEMVGNQWPFMTSMPPHIMLYFFLYQLRSFHNAGFELAIVISGHSGGNQRDYRLAAEIFMQYSPMQVLVFADNELVKDEHPGDHAGKYEISQLQFIDKDMVNMKNLDEVNTSKLGRFAQGMDAAEASAEYGKKLLELTLESIGEYLNKIEPQTNFNNDIMSYATVENMWNLLVKKKHEWQSLHLRPGQEPCSSSSVWKQFESEG